MRDRALFLLLATGCFTDTGAGPASMSGSDGSGPGATSADTNAATGALTGPPPGSTGGATGGPDQCPANAPCVQIPDGWRGPIVARMTDVGTPLTLCELADYPIADGRLMGDFSPAEASCECSCSAVGITQCEPATLERHVDLGCPGVPIDSWSLALDACTPVSLQDFDYLRLVPPSPSGNCNPEGVLSTAVPAAFGFEWHSCSAEALPLCGTGTCTPQIPQGAEFDRLCIRFDGDASCPAGGFFPAEYHVFVGQDDVLTCDGQCACGPPEPACSVQAQVYPDTACANSLGPVNQSSCVQITSGLGIPRAQLTTADLSPFVGCTATNPTVVAGGRVTPTSETTFCCTE